MCEQFGPSDFPVDAGIAYRNDFIKFALAFRDELHKPATGGKWPSTNVPLLTKLNIDQLIRIIGTLHFYAVTWEFCRQPTSPRELSNSLNWIFNVYGFPGSASYEWFQIAKQNGHALALPEGQQKMYSEVAAITGADSGDKLNAEGWSGIAFILLHAYEFDENKHAAWCREAFR